MLCWNYCRPGWSPGTRDAPRSPGRATPGGSRGPGPEGLRRLPHQAARRRSSCPALGARAEILVAGGSVLAGPLVELLALVAPAAVHVKAQAACLVLELIRAIGLACRQPETGRGAARRLLDDVRGAGRRARGRHVSTGVAGLELAVPARDRNELELLVSLAVAGPLVDLGARCAGVTGHVGAQAVAAYHGLVVARCYAPG